MTDSKTVVEDLAAWLTAVWDEEERLARAAPGRQWKAFVMDDVAGASVYDEQWVLLYPQHYDHDNPLSSDPGATGPMYIERAKDELCAHIAAHDPASVLARIAADRKILAACERVYRAKDREYGDGSHDLADEVMAQLASQYRDRPDFPEWLVERQGVEK